jgi:hypothetical protein
MVKHNVFALADTDAWVHNRSTEPEGPVWETIALC